MHLRLARYRGEEVRGRKRLLDDARRSSEVDAAAGSATELVLELDQATESAERRLVLLTVERSKHARVIAKRCDQRPQPLAERLAGRAAAQVVVAARPRRLGDDLDLAGVRSQ